MEKQVMSLPSSRDTAVMPTLWNPSAAGCWSLVFTPILGTILLAKNWRVLGDPAKAESIMFWVYIYVAYAAFILFVPEMGPVGSILLIVAWYFAACRPQEKFVRAHFGRSYTRRRWALPLLLATVLLVGYCLLAGILVSALG